MAGIRPDLRDLGDNLSFDEQVYGAKSLLGGSRSDDSKSGKKTATKGKASTKSLETVKGVLSKVNMPAGALKGSQSFLTKVHERKGMLRGIAICVFALVVLGLLAHAGFVTFSGEDSDSSGSDEEVEAAQEAPRRAKVSSTPIALMEEEQIPFDDDMPEQPKKPKVQFDRVELPKDIFDDPAAEGSATEDASGSADGEEVVAQESQEVTVVEEGPVNQSDETSSNEDQGSGDAANEPSSDPNDDGFGHLASDSGDGASSTPSEETVDGVPMSVVEQLSDGTGIPVEEVIEEIEEAAHAGSDAPPQCSTLHLLSDLMKSRFPSKRRQHRRLLGGEQETSHGYSVPERRLSLGRMGARHAATPAGHTSRHLLVKPYPFVDYVPQDAINTFHAPVEDKLLAGRIMKAIKPGYCSCKKTAVACGPEGERYGLRLKAGSLGTCAVVGLGRNLLDKEKGVEIDDHKTVIRLGRAPLERYMRHVGRKTSVLFVRSIGDLGTDFWDTASEHHGEHMTTIHPSLFFWMGDPVLADDENPYQAVPPTGKMVGMPYVRSEGLSNTTALSDLLSVLNAYVRRQGRAAQEGTEMKASSGFTVVTTLIQAQLCSRIDLYGFSQDGVGHYFDEGANYRPGGGFSHRNVAGLEHYVYKVAQANGLLCLYD
eukprot:jgi/Mesvir1/25744/Mv01925-RA.1